MKISHAACLLAFLPALAFAQSADAPPKPAPMTPVLARDHSGSGRIGVLLTFDKVTGLPSISALTRGGPAADFGFRVGDLIIKIDKNLTSSLTQDEIRLALHGDPGSSIELTIQRDDNPKFIVRSLTRRIPADGAELMVNPPMSGVANGLGLLDQQVQ